MPDYFAHYGGNSKNIATRPGAHTRRLPIVYSVFEANLHGREELGLSRVDARARVKARDGAMCG